MCSLRLGRKLGPMLRKSITFVVCAFLALSAQAQGPREQSDQRDIKKQRFIDRLPLQSDCKAEVTGGVLLPPGSKKWQSGSFEVEPQDHFKVVISTIGQLSPAEQEVCEAQALYIEPDDVQRNIYLEKGDIVCMRRTYDDKGRLPQLTACRVSALLTQPTHLRCKNNDPILDPDGMFIAPNLITAMTLPQAVVTKGTCQAADRF